MPRPKKNDDGAPKRTRKKKENVTTPTGDSIKMETCGTSNIMPFDSIAMGPGGSGPPGMHMQHNGGGGIPMGILNSEDSQQMGSLGGGISNPGNLSEFGGFYNQNPLAASSTHLSQAQQQGMPPDGGPYNAMPSQPLHMPMMSQAAPSSHPQQLQFNELEPPLSGMPGPAGFFSSSMATGGPSPQNGLSNGQPGHPLMG